MVSVVIPTHNRAHTLPRALDSVLAQSLPPQEIIVVDDGSTDETQKILAGYPVISIKTPRRGVSAARNTGVKNSKGDWIAFLDSDDAWLPRRLEKQFQLLQKTPLKWVHGEEIWIRRGRRVNPRKIHQKTGGFIFEQCLPRCLVSPSAVLMEKALLLEMGLFDEEFTVCEDYDLWLKTASLHPVGFVEEPVVVKHGGHPDQLSRRKAMDYWRIRSLERILKIRPLSPTTREKVVAEMLKKASVLAQGARRHNNPRNLAYARHILANF